MVQLSKRYWLNGKPRREAKLCQEKIITLIMNKKVKLGDRQPGTEPGLSCLNVHASMGH